MNEKEFDFPCSPTFREGLPSLSVDYRASDTFTGPSRRKPKSARNTGLERRVDSLTRELREERAIKNYYKEQFVNTDARLRAIEGMRYQQLPVLPIVGLVIYPHDESD